MTQTTKHQKLDSIWKRGCDFLGTEHAILGGAMSWISERNLVSAISNAGGFGIIACGSMNPDMLAAEIKATFELTKKPFGVNLITMHPELDALIDVCTELKVSHVVLAGGLPSSASIKRIKEGGAKAICFSPALILAKKLIRSGADALVIEGSEAGGHIGPVSTSVLVQEILPYIAKVPVFVAGGIGNGKMMASYMKLGASGCQIGTRFVCSTECVAHENFKKAFIKANARDAMPTVQIDPKFPVIPVRALQNKGTQEFMEFQKKTADKFHNNEATQKEAQLEIEHYWVGALRNAAIDGDVENGSLMAGQCVGMVKSEQPVSEIINEFTEQAEEALTVFEQP
ncbi:MAG: nitronate monooxygenase [Alphaproteobacteria bacterium]|nr:nitronate monooxygenase [Alphaproteobacteria bacterium]